MASQGVPTESYNSERGLGWVKERVAFALIMIAVGLVTGFVVFQYIPMMTETLADWISWIVLNGL